MLIIYRVEYHESNCKGSQAIRTRNINDQGAGPAVGHKASVLVVDDDAKILNIIRVSLRLAGYEVITATGGEEALKLLDLKKPDIMLLDILMSPVDGFEVLQRLRTTAKLPVIAISAHTSAAEKAISLGANDFIGEPFRPDELIHRIQALLKL